MRARAINGIKYYKLDDIEEEYTLFRKGCGTIEKLVEHYGIDETEYTYARQKVKVWTESKGNAPRYDKFFINQVWFDNKFNTEKKLVKIRDTTEYAPPILTLKEKEKFSNEDGTMQLEVRGKRTASECYFKVEDISKGFALPKLRDMVTDVNSSHVEGKHYSYFFVPLISGKGRVKKLFLTYHGILRVLYSSRGKNAEIFTDWATEILFAVQLGTTQQKTKLAGKLLGVDMVSLIDSLKAVAGPAVAAIYFILIGTVKDLRKKYNLDESLDDGDLVAKYGKTGDLIRRIGEHKTKYGKQIEMLVFSIIDPTLVTKAENALDLYFEKDLLDITINGNRETELVTVNKANLKTIKSQYTLIGTNFACQVSKVAEMIKDITHKHETDLMVKDKELTEVKHEKELIIEKYENKLLQKDNELLKKDNKLLAKKSDVATKTKK